MNIKLEIYYLLSCYSAFFYIGTSIVIKIKSVYKINVAYSAHFTERASQNNVQIQIWISVVVNEKRDTYTCGIWMSVTLIPVKHNHYYVFCYVNIITLLHSKVKVFCNSFLATQSAVLALSWVLQVFQLSTYSSIEKNAICAIIF